MFLKTNGIEYVSVLMEMKRQSRSGFRCWQPQSSVELFPWRATWRRDCHRGACSCLLLRRSGLPLSSRLQHMLNLHRDILPRRRARFSVNQADLTQRHEHILPDCHDADVENTFSEFLSKARSRLIRTGVGRHRTAAWVGAQSREASGTGESSALALGLTPVLSGLL